MTIHLADGVHPQGLTKLRLEEGGQTSLGTGRGAVLPPLGLGSVNCSRAEEAVHILRRLSVLPAQDPANGTEGAEGAGDRRQYLPSRRCAGALQGPRQARAPCVGTRSQQPWRG
jgi:hypothetical protein